MWSGFPAPAVASSQQGSARQGSGEVIYRMPYAPKHPCGYPGCAALIEAGNSRCEKHRIQERRELDRQRGSATARGYGSKWRKASKEFLSQHPLCTKCYAMGILRSATVVDHVVPHKGDFKLFWDRTNWQPLCKRCHDKKTVMDGRWT
jgi:5-methylcytosine-specific restriction enzyme A